MKENKNIMVVKGIVKSSFYDNTNGTGSIKLTPDSESINELVDFYTGVGYRNKRFTPEIIDNPNSDISLKTKFNLKHFQSSGEVSEITAETFGKIAEGTEITVALTRKEGKTVYPYSILYDGFIPEKEIEVFNPFE